MNTKPSNMMAKTRYRNTDLDLISAMSLDGLIHEIEGAGMILLGSHKDTESNLHANFEILSEDEKLYADAQATIVAMLTILDNLSAASKKIWEGCHLRELNVAYDTREEPIAFNEGFSVETLTRMSALNMSFRVTMYPKEQRKPS